MTERIDIDEIERLIAAATPGPWSDAGNKIGSTGGGIAEVEFDEEADLALVIALRNAAPALLAELRQRRAELRAGAIELGRQTFEINRLVSERAAERARAEKARADLARKDAELREARECRTVWLIERRAIGAPTRWWSGPEHRPSLEWGDAHGAVRFVRKEDAERFVVRTFAGSDEVIVTEHVFMRAHV